METKEIKINVPEGYEIDKENSTFDCIKFKPVNKLPKTWAEFCKTHPIIDGEESFICTNSEIESFSSELELRKERLFEYDRNILPSRKMAEAMRALCQLIQLRDCYNDGWKPNWADENLKHCILVEWNKIVVGHYISQQHQQHILSFKTPQLRDEFYDNFKDLIEIAKPLI